MNNIILDNSKVFNLNINKDSILDITNHEIEILTININNSKCIINYYSEYRDVNTKFIINQNINSNVEFNIKFKNNTKLNMNIIINLCDKSNNNIINIRGINDSGDVFINIDGSVEKDTIDNSLYENIKILNINNGKNIVKPNMFIDTNNVICNHACSISDINKDYLFYLNSKGISVDKAKDLIIEGFIK